LLFTSLIENAFKYGVSYQQNSFIDIQLSTTEKELNFRIKNSKTATPNKDKSTSGIGLENTRKRLDLIFNSNYKMDITETVDTFLVELKLPL
jgi:sensor histidine kinase YesM